MEILVDDWSRAQKEDRTLRLDKVLNQNGAVHELEKHEGAVYDAARPLVWQELWLDEGQDGQRKSEENCEDLEGNQLWEGFIDVAAVTEAQAEVLERDPGDHSGSECILFVLELSRLHAMNLAQQHQEDVDDLVCCVVEQELLEGEG